MKPLYLAAFNLACLALFLWMAQTHPVMGLFAGFCIVFGARATCALRRKGVRA